MLQRNIVQRSYRSAALCSAALCSATNGLHVNSLHVNHCVMALAVWAICFRVAKIANATIGILVMTKSIAPCARPGGAGVEGGKAWVMAWVVHGS